jgi:hypothetical protein
MAFDLKKKSAIAGETPEALFRDLRGRTVEGLLAHQADLLRDYVQNALDEPDVAFQLPTGSGKTLVGLLVAEWRRRRNQERVLYLCPTNQLVYQVTTQARSQYGMDVMAFTGRKADYSEEAKSAYAKAEAVAVTSYSSLFNVKPHFRDAQLIILDDAHATENYIASAWTLHVNTRTESHRPLFAAIAGVLKRVISPTDHLRMTADHPESRSDELWVDSVPGPALFQVIDELTSVIDAGIWDADDLGYRWTWLKGHLDACQLYIGRGDVLIRPLIPPTSTHAPFNGAVQRIYMSATLGAGGDLERLTGRKNIKRLAIPAGWEKQGVGRRLFLFPSGALKPEALKTLVSQIAVRSGRSVILTTDLQSEQALGAMISDSTSFPVFNAHDLEESKAEFVRAEQAVAVIANRYDGIDFPGDECRTLMIDELPSATNLQERFFSSRVGASVLLRDRVMTRLVQGVGRCTRGATDYAAVVVISESVFTYLAAPDRRALLHPELQAELQFGLDQSQSRGAGDFLDNLDLFLKQDEGWHEADAAIVELREGKKQSPLPGASDLLRAVSSEVDYQYAMWSGRFADALDSSRTVLACLVAPELRGYRALWHYLAGNAAVLANRTKQLDDGGAAAREQYRFASRAVDSFRWLSDLAQYVGIEKDRGLGDADLNATHLIERLEMVFQDLGSATNFRLDAAEHRILKGLLSPDGEGFESAHVELGHLLGYHAGKDTGDASPDPWWTASEKLCFVFEDHAAAGVDGLLDATKARQAATHDNWIRKNVPGLEYAEVVKILITPVTRAHKGAMPHLQDVFTWPLESFRQWAKNALAILRDLKKTFREPGDLAWRSTALEAYQRSRLSPLALKELVTSESAAMKWIHN